MGAQPWLQPTNSEVENRARAPHFIHTI
jgi:hypothetical protein